MASLRCAAASAALALLAACASGGSTPPPAYEPPPAPTRPGFDVPPPSGEYDDLTGQLNVWKSAVLDRVEGPALARLVEHLQARVQMLRARDVELQAHPAGVAIERRLELARQLAFDEACLKLAEEKRGR